MEKKEIVIVADYTQEKSLTFKELCELCGISSDFVHGLVEYEIIHPKTSRLEQEVFNLVELQRIKTVLRLQHDLEVNMAGAAVVLDLLDELEELRAEMQLVQKHYLR